MFVVLKVSTFVTAFHEAVFLYAEALNETIAEGFSSTNGSLITRKMWNKTFSGEYYYYYYYSKFYIYKHIIYISKHLVQNVLEMKYPCIT